MPAAPDASPPAGTRPPVSRVNLDLTDGQTHDVEFYFLDWDTTARSESVQISNAVTGAVLDTETVTSFHSGVYLDWALSGDVNITITRSGRGQRRPQRPVLWTRPRSTAPTAPFIGQDTTTQGNWIGTYGSQGYDVIGNAASLPSYATVTPIGADELHLDTRARPTRGRFRMPAAPDASPPAGTRPPVSPSTWT